MENVKFHMLAIYVENVKFHMLAIYVHIMALTSDKYLVLL